MEISLATRIKLDIIYRWLSEHKDDPDISGSVCLGNVDSLFEKFSDDEGVKKAIADFRKNARFLKFSPGSYDVVTHIRVNGYITWIGWTDNPDNPNDTSWIERVCYLNPNQVAQFAYDLTQTIEQLYSDIDSIRG